MQSAPAVAADAVAAVTRTRTGVNVRASARHVGGGIGGLVGGGSHSDAWAARVCGACQACRVGHIVSWTWAYVGVW